MKEPSVLDYLKSRLPWSKEKLDLPLAEAGSSGLEHETPAPKQEKPAETAPEILEPVLVPWRTLLALALALYAQYVLDPAPFAFANTGNSLRQSDFQKALYIGLVFYGLAAIFLVWAYVVKEISLPALPDDTPVTDPQTAGRWWVVAALVVALVDYPFLGDNIFLPSNNLFNPFNTTLWLVAMAMFVRGLWLHGQPESQPVVEGETALTGRARSYSVFDFLARWWDAILFLCVAFFIGMQPGSNIFLFGFWPLVIALVIIAWRNPDGVLTPWQHIKTLFTRDSWQFKITRWTLLVIVVSAVVIFFRLYRLDGVPAEPFSDHAEKLLDIYDVTQGLTHIFFERNTGREFDTFYFTVLVINVFRTGLTFFTLKLVTALFGLFAMPFVYLLGKELGGKRVGLFALFLAGVSYWLNVDSRVGLRYPLYASLTAPTLFFLVRGLRTQKRNDFIRAGLFLGLGLNGYSAFRIVPVLVVVTVALYLLHKFAQGHRKQALMMLSIVVVGSFLVCVPLIRYGVDHPDMVSYRSITRLTGDNESGALPTTDWCPAKGNLAAGTCTFLSNTFKAGLMFFWDNGSIWVHSVPGHPALDIAAAMLFAVGYLLVFIRYLRERRWQDIFLLLAVPLLLMPSILSLAFPDENPSLNRTAAAAIVVFVIAAMALDGVYLALQRARFRGWLRAAPIIVVILFLGLSSAQSYDLVLNQYATEFQLGAWNTSDIGRVIRAFIDEGNSPNNAWVIPFPYWVDTRLVGIQAGEPTKDYAINREDLPTTQAVAGSKLFIIKKGDDPDSTDTATLAALQQLYPNGILGVFDSPLPGKDFWIYSVPAAQTVTTP